MGTSSRYGGPSQSSALIPTFLGDPGGGGGAGVGQQGTPTPGLGVNPVPPPGPAGVPPQQLPPLPPPGDAGRFRSSRLNFNSFATSRDRGSLRKSLSSYVSKGAGGGRSAARRMGSSVRSAGRAIGFVQDVARVGVNQALANLGVRDLVGQPAEQALAALTDVVCPAGGPIDEGIAREAWDEAVLNLTDAGFTDLTQVTAEQWQALVADFIAKSIETRVINDVGVKGISLPEDIRAINQLQHDLHEVIRGAVDDAIGDKLSNGTPIPQNELLSTVTDIYEKSFSYLQALRD